jgi:hypothetical protein
MSMDKVSSVRPHLLSALILILGLGLGCDRDDKVVVYTTPKQTSDSSATPSANPTPTIDTTNMPPVQAEIQWTVPQGWKELPGDGQMRYASFQVLPDHPDLQLSVIPLGAEAADLLPNINRWEGQVGLPSSSLTELPRVVKRVTVGDLNIDTVDLVGPETANPRQRMLAAILPHADKTWFFKLFGPADVIGSQSGNFDAFIKSIHFANGAPPPAAQANASGAAGATWNIPAGWSQEPDKPMRVASFKAGDAELIVTQFGKDNFGGALANINRWRGQAGLDQVSDENAASAQPVTVNNNPGKLYDFAGPTTRVHVEMIEVGDNVWFFKLVGPTAAVAQQQPAFDEFLKSVSFK